MFILYILIQIKYNKSIIKLLKNDLTNSWSEINKICLILSMVSLYVQCEKAGEEDEKLGSNERTLDLWPRVLEVNDYIRLYYQ